MKTRHLSSYFCFSYKSITSSRLVCKIKISLAVSFHAKAESAMSRISDVVNKIMQISGEMVCSLNNEAKYRQLAFIEIILI